MVSLCRVAVFGHSSGDGYHSRDCYGSREVCHLLPSPFVHLFEVLALSIKKLMLFYRGRS